MRIDNLYRNVMIWVTIVACALATSCKKGPYSPPGEVNNETASRIGFYETYRVTEIAEILSALNEEATSHNADADSATFGKLTGFATLVDISPNAPIVGMVAANDTAAVDSIIARYGAEFLPPDLKLAWKFKPVEDGTSRHGCYELIALRTSGVQRGPAMTGETITAAQYEFAEQIGCPVIDLKFDDAGAKELFRVTSINLARNLAIVIGEKVYCFPMVQSPVEGGLVQITGDFTEEEATQIVDYIYGQSSLDLRP